MNNQAIKTTAPPQRLHLVLGVCFLIGLLISGIHPKDSFTWFLEVFPAILGFGALILTYRQFQFTTLAYVLMLVHALILCVGGHYTYAEVPLFDWLRDFLGQSRNNYDKVGHFAQGFVPAIIARELLARHQVVNNKHWLPFLVISVCVFISAMYELIEWWVAVLTGDSADAFLGTQGYVWDTQSDIFVALIGAVAGLILLTKLHDKALKTIT